MISVTVNALRITSNRFISNFRIVASAKNVINRLFNECFYGLV
jgi:hypothetical protein